MGSNRASAERWRALAWWLFFLPQTVGSTVWRFLKNWFLSRNVGLLLRGLPALAVAVGLGFAAEVASSVPTPELVARYQRSAATAEEKGNLGAARLWLEKAVLLEPDAPQHQYELALADKRQGRLDQAREALRRIAPRDGRGYPDAHFWLARDLLAGQPALTAEQADTLEHHLTEALRSRQAASEARALLGELYLLQKKFGPALAHYAAAAEQRPELRLTVGQLHLLLGQTAQANSQLAKAARYLRQRSEQQPEDLEALLSWAQAELLLGNLAESERILKAGRERFDDPRLAEGLAAVRLAEFDSLRRDEPANVERAQMLLEQADDLTTNHTMILERLSQFAQDGPSARAAARRMLTRMVADGPPNAEAYFLLGGIAVRDEDVEAATRHFEAGLKLQPDSAVLLNNLAWALASADPPDLDRALQLIDRAHQKSPQRAEVLETRGQILAKLGRWKECVADLEQTLRLMPEQPQVHETLALAYEELGDREMADQHRQRAAALKSAGKESP